MQEPDMHQIVWQTDRQTHALLSPVEKPQFVAEPNANPTSVILAGREIDHNYYCRYIQACLFSLSTKKSNAFCAVELHLQTVAWINSGRLTKIQLFLQFRFSTEKGPWSSIVRIQLHLICYRPILQIKEIIKKKRWEKKLRNISDSLWAHFIDFP